LYARPFIFYAREGLLFSAFPSFEAYALEAITFKFMEALGIKSSL
jgi:hypothetical protein